MRETPEPVQKRPAPARETLLTKWDRWMVNEGGQRLFFVVFILLQGLLAGFGFLNYYLKDNLNNARGMFGITYRMFPRPRYVMDLFIISFLSAIARTAALVLNVHSALVLLPICRNFISQLRRTPLNRLVPFDKNVNFHKAVAWSIVFWTVVHVLAHMVNFYRLALQMPVADGVKGRIFGFLGANFATGPGITGWIMTLCLIIMVFLAVEKARKKNYERFFYSHHLFIPFFVAWQLHGMFCMIKPDRPPFCSANTIGLFWVSSTSPFRLSTLIEI